MLILGLTGIVVGILNSYDHFTGARTEPGALEPDHPPRTRTRRAAHELGTRKRLYIYAVAILVATIAQFLLPLPWLRGLDGRLHMAIDIHDPAVKRTFV